MTQIETLKQEMREVLENNILRFWIDRMQDEEHGGFYGRIDNGNVLHKDAEKGAILNARILWTFSAAYRVLRKPEYLEMADRAKRYFIDHFIDPEYGGVYWSLDYMGQPKDTKKQFYAIGFAIYGLSEYARATGDREALEYALDLDANYPKSQNTHLHIIEPYANLLRCLKEMRSQESCDYVPAIGAVLPIGISVPVETIVSVEASLRNIISIFTDRILNPETHHLDLFFEMDWTRGAGQLESYGHDIECSWLMHEAALVLGDQKILAKMEPIVQIVAKASEKGLNADGSMIHEANLTAGTKDDDLHWWVQAETVVGFYNIYQYFHDEAALEKACRCWQYIKDNLIDYQHGEWYWSRHRDGSLNTTDDKAGFWKCPYHNGRMCLEIMERASY